MSLVVVNEPGATAMGVNFTPQEGSVLYRLLAEDTSDIILKTDCEGFIVHASPAIRQLGLLLPGMLIGPHLLDLVHPASRETVREQHQAAIDGRQSGEWTEFAAITRDHEERWFAVQTRSLRDDGGQVYGALSIMRSVEERRSFEKQLFIAAMTDPLTGLTNRPAFISMLQHLVDSRVGGSLAMFDIDHFKAINMQHGHAVGDEVLVVFSDLLRTSMRSNDIISRIGGENLAVLFPATEPDQAKAICQRIVTMLSEIRRTASASSLTITASAGVSRIGGSLDHTIKRAELALFLAKAKGGNRLEMDTGPKLAR